MREELRTRLWLSHFRRLAPIPHVNCVVSGWRITTRRETLRCLCIRYARIDLASSFSCSPSVSFIPLPRFLLLHYKPSCIAAYSLSHLFNCSAILSEFVQLINSNPIQDVPATATRSATGTNGWEI